MGKELTFNPMFKEKSPRNLIKCVECGHKFSGGKIIQDKNGNTSGWAYNTECPKCGTINEGVKAVWKETLGVE